MKVAILSMQHVNNFGSVLQAYSLKKIVEEISGGQVFFLPIKPGTENQQFVLPGMSHSFERDAAGLKKYDKYIVYRALNKLAMKKQNKLFANFKNTVLQLQKTADQFEVCIIGSDEVFNCRIKSQWGFTTQLFGNIPNAEKVITYAASCGFTKSDMLNDYMREEIARAFKKISAFSVRDKNTYDFVHTFTQKEITYHLDPVLVGDFDPEIAVAEKKLKDYGDNLCVVYSYHNRIYDSESIRSIKRFAHKHNLKLISIGAPQKWIPRMFPLEPFEMLALFKKARFVITDTFHGTIFSAKYNGKFAVLVRESNKNKLNDLVERLGVEDHVIKAFEQLDYVFDLRSTTEDVGKIIAEERERTLEYLRHYI